MHFSKQHGLTKQCLTYLLIFLELLFIFTCQVQAASLTIVGFSLIERGVPKILSACVLIYTCIIYIYM